MAVATVPLGLATTPAVATPGTFSNFSTTGISLEITTGPDGNIWFTEQTAHKIGKITPAGVVTEYSTAADVFPSNIHAGPDGKIYYTEFRNANDGHFARMNTDGTGYEQFDAPTFNAGVRSMVTGPDGKIWIAEQVASKLLRFDPVTKAMKEFRTGTNNQPWGITVGSDGNIWYTLGASNQIGRMTTSGSGKTEFNIPTANALPLGMALGPDGNVWFVEGTGNKIAKITPAGVISEQPALPTAFSRPKRIAAGPDGNLWFTENAVHKIGRISTAGALTEYAIPVGGGPFGITRGPDDKMWFAHNGAAMVGNVTEL